MFDTRYCITFITIQTYSYRLELKKTPKRGQGKVKRRKMYSKEVAEVPKQ